MKEVSVFLYQYFTTLSVFTDVMDLRFYPVIANQETPKPLAIYNVTQQMGITKDCDKFTVTVSGYFDPNDYDEAADFSDVITEIVKSDSKFNWIDSEISFIQEDLSFAANISFEIEYIN
jgi:hypothetical protein